MKIIDAPQGSEAWHAHRNSNTYFNASESPAMMCESPYQKRNELLAEKAGAIVRQIDAATQKRFDDGHRFEALARPHAERFIGDDLYPILGVEGRYSASFDGLTEDYMTAFEHKSLNDTIRACSCAAELPAYLRIQMEHQLMVCGGERVLFMASKWNDDDELVEEKHFYYEPDLALRKKIIAGWEQFAIDLANYKHVEAAPVAVAEPVRDLPVLLVELSGRVVSSNLAEWKSAVVQQIDSIKTELNDDQDFADAEAVVKMLKEAAKRIDVVKAQAQSQASSIDELFRTMDEIKGIVKARCKELDDKVTARKEKIRFDIITEGKTRLEAHIAELAKPLQGLKIPAFAFDFAAAVKGKRNLATTREAMENHLLQKRMEASEIAARISINLLALDTHAKEQRFLFSDLQAICAKPEADFLDTMNARLAAHKAAEDKRLADEREKIRAEEEAKAKAKQEAEAKTAVAPTAPTLGDVLAVAAPAAIVAALTTVDVTTVAANNGAITGVNYGTRGAVTRPTDAAIIDVLAMHYRVHESKVIEWLLSMDLTAASERMVAHI